LLIDAFEEGLEYKAVTVGSHRSRPPEETIAWITPKLPAAGITRVADITGLDAIGIPVWQAVRPAARTLAVSQGKGYTPALAKVSAMMEAIELWHAEQRPERTRTATPRGIADELPYDPCSLPMAYGSFFHADLPLEWVVASVGGQIGRQTWVPVELVHLDASVRRELSPPIFDTSSNGLASGNSYEEAALHGLLELIERDSLASGRGSRRAVDPAGIAGYPSLLVDKYDAAGVDLQIDAVQNRFEMPCFQAAIFSEEFPEVFLGSGCHLDPDVALSRALTEAAQARLTVIAGTRDDLTPDMYRRTASDPSVQSRRVRAAFARAERSGAPFERGASELISTDLANVIQRISDVVSAQPLLFDHTRPDMNVPVVHAIVPGMVR
jgi:ribosomal protein S12 methylthiotransferase accessory factor